MVKQAVPYYMRGDKVRAWQWHCKWPGCDFSTKMVWWLTWMDVISLQKWYGGSLGCEIGRDIPTNITSKCNSHLTKITYSQCGVSYEIHCLGFSDPYFRVCEVVNGI